MMVAVSLLSNTGIAQENENDMRSKLLFGLKAGANYSNVYDAEGQEFTADPKFGLAGGAFLAVPIGKYIGIQPEVLFSQKGFKGSTSILGTDFEFTRTTSYIDVPLLLALKPLSFLTILAGPQFSYLVNRKDVFSDGTNEVEEETAFENDDLRKNTFCFTGGLDFNMDHFVIGTRIGWDIQKNNGDGTSTALRYKNVWYQATLGYRF